MSEIWNGAAKRLDAWDYGRLGRLLGVGEDEIHRDLVALVRELHDGGRLRATLPEPRHHVHHVDLGVAEHQSRAGPLGSAHPISALKLAHGRSDGECITGRDHFPGF